MTSNLPPTRLRELREAHNPKLSRQQLAVEMGWSLKTIERYENGEIPLKPLKQLCLRFGVTVGYMLREDHPVAA